MVEPKPRKPKFKYTRELVKIALADGMTQKEVGDLCRVEQSVVSGWFNGKSLALEHQVAELKKRYGHRLNRTTSRVYQVRAQRTSDAHWEESALGKRLLALRDRLARESAVSIRRRGLEPAVDGLETQSLDDAQSEPLKSSQEELRELQEAILAEEKSSVEIGVLIEVDKEDFEAARRPIQVTQVEGPVVFRYTFVRLVPVMRKMVELARIPVARWLVHRHLDGRFVLVQQERRVLTGRARWSWRKTLKSLQQEARERFSHGIRSIDLGFAHLADEEPYVECADDSARWLSVIHGPFDSNALLSHCDAFFAGPGWEQGAHDALSLPFLLRKMLVEHGHEVSGVVRILSSE
ncbi:hypothetical protein ACQKGO_21745 [Corallococcus interemptor]|uniref:hypothetical protein n=1 Tax=Corallococcus interemptor TaxID=2316720 RepID=UPI003CFBDC7D